MGALVMASMRTRRFGVALRLAALCAALLPAGCSVPEKFSMYPTALGADTPVAQDQAVVLVGNAGPVGINSLQFTHSSMPAINATVDLPPGGVVAIPMPPGIRQLSLGTYTLSGKSAGYLPSGMNYGYIAVRTPKIDIAATGAYYVATIRPDAQPNFTTAPDAAMLARFAKAHPQVAKLRPVNFTWPK